MTRPLSDVVANDRYDLNGSQTEYRLGWNNAMDHVARECLPSPPTPSPVIAGLIELRDAMPIVRPHDWPGVVELADLDSAFDHGGPT